MAERGTHPIRTSDDWWALVLGSGYRGTLDQLAPEDRAHVRDACAAFIRAGRVRSVEVNVVFAVCARG